MHEATIESTMLASGWSLEGPSSLCILIDQPGGKFFVGCEQSEDRDFSGLLNKDRNLSQKTALGHNPIPFSSPRAKELY